MVKYFALLAAVVVSLVAVDMAEAGRHRCRSCGGCSGGSCYVEPSKTASTDNAPPAVASTPVTPVAATPAPVYSTARRGFFGWRR